MRVCAVCVLTRKNKGVLFPFPPRTPLPLINLNRVSTTLAIVGQLSILKNRVTIDGNNERCPTKKNHGCSEARDYEYRRIFCGAPHRPSSDFVLLMMPYGNTIRCACHQKPPFKMHKKGRVNVHSRRSVKIIRYRSCIRYRIKMFWRYPM